MWRFANLARRHEPDRAQLAALSGPDTRVRLLDLFADDAGPAVEIIDARPDIMPTSLIHTLANLPTWHRNRMIVIGGAAHAPSPTTPPRRC